MTKTRKAVSFSIDASLWEDVRRISAEDDRPISRTVERVLREFVRQEKNTPRPTLAS